MKKLPFGVIILSVLATFAGIMNLIYVGNIMSKPVLDLAFYETLFSGPESFRATETLCRSKGDPHCEVVAERRSFARG